MTCALRCASISANDETSAVPRETPNRGRNAAGTRPERECGNACAENGKRGSLVDQQPGWYLEDGVSRLIGNGEWQPNANAHYK
jgi:hypothetical protein